MPIYKVCKTRGVGDPVLYNVFVISIGFGAGRRLR
jgi:hypothetical protein